jgi:hypothetical protein
LHRFLALLGRAVLRDIAQNIRRQNAQNRVALNPVAHENSSPKFCE